MNTVSSPIPFSGTLPVFEKRTKRSKESHTAWLYRLCSPSLEESISLTPAVMDNKPCNILSFKIHPERERIIRNVLSSGNTVKKDEGAVVLIANQDNSQFIVTRKDDKHPVKEFCNCLSLFGGGVEEEDPMDSAKREIYEEVLSAVVADQIVENMVFLGSEVCSFYAASRDVHYNMKQSLYYSKANSIEQYEFWLSTINSPIGVTEANVEIVDRHEFIEAVENNKFIAGLSKIISKYVRF